MGNSNNRDLASYGLAEKLTAIEILENILKDSLRNANIPAFLDRLIYVEFLRESYQILKDINIDDNGLTLVLQPAIARGVIKLLREKFLRDFKLGEVENRADRAVKVLTAILKLLGLDELAKDQGIIEELVRGELTFWQAIIEKNNAKTKGDIQASDDRVIKGDSMGLSNGGLEDNSSNSEDNNIEYITVKITLNNGNETEIVGVDGKVYVIKDGETIKLPKKNAEALIKVGIAKLCG